MLQEKVQQSGFREIRQIRHNESGNQVEASRKLRKQNLKLLYLCIVCIGMACTGTRVNNRFRRIFKYSKKGYVFTYPSDACFSDCGCSLTISQLFTTYSNLL